MLPIAWVERSRGCDACARACIINCLQRLTCRLTPGCTRCRASRQDCGLRLPSDPPAQCFRRPRLQPWRHKVCFFRPHVQERNGVVAQSKKSREKQFIRGLQGRMRCPSVDTGPHAIRCSPACRVSWGALECCRLVSKVPKTRATSKTAVLTASGAHERPDPMWKGWSLARDKTQSVKRIIRTFITGDDSRTRAYLRLVMLVRYWNAIEQW
jgi:hypothetical protein